MRLNSFAMKANASSAKIAARTVVLRCAAASLLLAAAAAQNPFLQLFACAPPPAFSQHQRWALAPVAGANGSAIVYAASLDTGAVCAAVQGAPQPGARLWPYGCGSPPGPNQRFELLAGGALAHAPSGLCVRAAAGAGGEIADGAAVVLAACDGSAPQTWALDAASGQLAVAGGAACLDWNSPLRAGPCARADSAALPFCDASLPLAARVADLVARVAAGPERAGLLNTVQAAVDNATERVHTPDLQWWSEALHGVAASPGVQFGGAARGATAVPQVVLTAASFNVSLFAAVGATVGREARAMNNIGQGGLTYWSPTLNLPRDARWGRAQEAPGEDSVTLMPAYARAFVRGLQEAPDVDARYLQVSAACKHFVAYDLEDWNGTDRHHFDAVVSERDLLDSFAPPFQACAEDARASGVMCAYNSVSGVPACASAPLLTDLLRGEWGFNGYVVSDCGAVGDIQYAHNYTNTSDATARAVLTSGMDIGCDPFLVSALGPALASGAVTDADVGRAMANFLAVRFRLGVFDEPYSAQPLRRAGAEAVCADAALALALDAAQQGITLVKNDDASLPLRAGARLAVLGPLANRTDVMLGSYFGPGCPGALQPIAQAAAAFAGGVTFEPGCDVDSNDTSRLAAAVAAAGAADATVLVVGIDQSVAREGVDRADISLPGEQPALVARACAARSPSRSSSNTCEYRHPLAYLHEPKRVKPRHVPPPPAAGASKAAPTRRRDSGSVDPQRRRAKASCAVIPSLPASEPRS